LEKPDAFQVMTGGSKRGAQLQTNSHCGAINGSSRIS
jgi:hypothetical protein